MFIGSVFTPWALVWGAVPVTVTLIGWFWPRADETRKQGEIEIKPAAEAERIAALSEAMS
jgi:cytochrome c oxidase subunit 1